MDVSPSELIANKKIANGCLVSHLLWHSADTFHHTVLINCMDGHRGSTCCPLRSLPCSQGLEINAYPIPDESSQQPQILICWDKFMLSSNLCLVLTSVIFLSYFLLVLSMYFLALIYATCFVHLSPLHLTSGDEYKLWNSCLFSFLH